MDYIAQLPGNEDPRKWYDRFPSLAEAREMEAEEKTPIEMMIARDNWKWMPVRQASRLTERQDKAKIRDKRLLARTQFGKRLLLLPCVEASEVVLQRKTTRIGTLREESVKIPRPPQECWIKRRKKMRNGSSAERRSSVGMRRCIAEEPKTGEGPELGDQDLGSWSAGS